MVPLYVFEDSIITDVHLAQALRNLGVESGDMVFMHSDVGSFGKLATTDTQAFLGGITNTVKAVVGERGTVIMPTFTFSWGRGEPFDIQHTRTSMGSLPEFFRTLPSVIRSWHPMHSVAACGTRAQDVTSVSCDTFGAGSVFEHLRTFDAKILMFGVDFTYCTFLIHVEQMLGVPYRFKKKFQGTIIDSGVARKDAIVYFARPLEGGIDNDMQRIEAPLLNAGLLDKITIGAGTARLVRARVLFGVASDLLVKNPCALLTKESAAAFRNSVEKA